MQKTATAAATINNQRNARTASNQLSAGDNRGYKILFIFIVCSLIIISLFYLLYEKYKLQPHIDTYGVLNKVKYLELIYANGFNNDLCKKIIFELNEKNATYKITSFYTKYTIKGKYVLKDDNQLLLYKDDKIIGVMYIKGDSGVTGDTGVTELDIEDYLGNVAKFKTTPIDRHITSKKYTFFVF